MSVSIYIDADACPVKEEAIRVAERHGIKVFMVGNTWHRISRHPLVEAVVVPQGPDAADDWIAERIEADDVAITNDIPLASRCVQRGARVVTPDGRPLAEESIGMAVAMRDLMTHLRSAGEITSGPAGYVKQDRSRFLQALDTAIQAATRRK